MENKQYRSRSSTYAVAGSSALAYPRYTEDPRRQPSYEEQRRVPTHEERRRAPSYADQRRMPTYEQRIPLQPPVRRRQVQGVHTLTMVVALGAVFAVLAGLSLGKRAESSGLQGQIAKAQQHIAAVQESNHQLEQRLSSQGNGEDIRSYAVNELGMIKIAKENIRSVHMPDTRPLGREESTSVQKKEQEEGGFIAMIADLLRQIPI